MRPTIRGGGGGEEMVLIRYRLLPKTGQKALAVFLPKKVISVLELLKG